AGPRRDAAIARLHALLLRAARFEVGRRRAGLPHLRGGSFDDLATQSADDALVAILAKLDDFRGESRFTTWAYKFALLEAAVRLRRLSWQNLEVPLEPASWDFFAGSGVSPHAGAETRELLGALRIAIEEQLTAHQRDVLVAVTLTGVPIDVLAERLGTTRGALYKTLHDARQKLRACLADQGLDTKGVAG
ncbi:MAG: sigma-70 family RNA polymerase sigma factor, partial [Thermoleophilaceae bacterium]|nr:sigma-70 family RNA polymerase sigma factor [Thermoleophilaceae bacterium]